MGDDRLGVGGRCEIDVPVSEPAGSFPGDTWDSGVCWRVVTRYVAASQTGYHH